MIKKKLNVAIFTGNRAEYGLMRYLIASIESHPKLCLQIMVGGAHLSAIHGMTIREIEADRHLPAALIPISLDQKPQPEMAILTAETIHGVSNAILRLKPDLLIVLGDRYETYGAASAAHLHRVPICHLHGGETTKGAIDDRLRHAITQLSTWHFCAADQYRQRIIAMGQPKDNVINVGPMTLDALKNNRRLNRQEFESQTGYRFGEINLIATFHPETLKEDFGYSYLKSLFTALEKYQLQILFTMPNADEGNKEIISAISHFQSKHSESVWLIPSLGQEKYLSALFLFDGMIGNSSSGIIEAPLAGLPILNIGDRQGDRLRFGNVIEAKGGEIEVEEGLNKLLQSINKKRRYPELNQCASPSSIIIEWLMRYAEANLMHSL